MSEFCTPELRNAILSMDVSETYMAWMEKVCANSPLPGFNKKDPRVKHLEFPIAKKKVKELFLKLEKIDGYYFGISVRRTAFNQSTIIIIKYGTTEASTTNAA